MLALIERLEGERHVEHPKFKLLPVLSEGRKFVTLEKRGLQDLATNTTSRKHCALENKKIKDKFASLEGFFDLEGIVKKN